MAKIEGFRVRNFKALKDVSLGRLWKHRESRLTPLTVVIGKNGVGKSTLFDAFGFLSDCLRFGVEEACGARGPRGFKNILSNGEKGPIEFEVYYRENGGSRPVIYELSIDLDKSGRPFVLKERLSEAVRIKEILKVRKYSFLLLKNGKGNVWSERLIGSLADTEDDGLNAPTESASLCKSKKESGESEFVELDDMRKLGIATLGAFKRHPRISAFRRFIEGWHLSYFTPDAARSRPNAGHNRHLNTRGDNLANVLQFMESEHPKRFRSIVRKVAKEIPGISKISTKETIDGKLLIRFADKGFRQPFYAQHVSDGTLKLLSYLVLLEDPNPPPFLCVEEPENGLYHKLLESLAMEFREHAADTQIFVTTHQPYFVDGLNPDEVWILEKGDSGFSTIHRASNNLTVTSLVEQELPLGGLWYSDYLDAR